MDFVYEIGEDGKIHKLPGNTPVDIEAHQHDRKERQPTSYPIDDKSQFLPCGHRRSEKWIAEREAREARQSRQAPRYVDPEINDDHPRDNSNDAEVNTRQVSMTFEQILPALLVIVCLIIGLAIYLVAQ